MTISQWYHEMDTEVKQVCRKAIIRQIMAGSKPLDIINGLAALSDNGVSITGNVRETDIFNLIAVCRTEFIA
jgi:hypothetical protein